MVQIITLLTTLAGMSAAAVMAAPSGGVTITVKNQCSSSLQVNQLTNGGGAGSAFTLAAGSSQDVNVASGWGGRFWGREGCSDSSDCHSGAPASLAEFLMNGSGGKDFYDVSFVDGFNLPIGIEPNGGSGSGYECGSPACSALPTCPSELQQKDGNGNVIGCMSACSAFGTSEYCCTGSNSTPGTCPSNKYASQIKSACPSVYSYAYDDATSTYSCAPSSGYTVTFCP